MKKYTEQELLEVNETEDHIFCGQLAEKQKFMREQIFWGQEAEKQMFLTL